MRKVFFVALLMLAAACKEGDPIRATIDQVADAAEDRDVDDVMKHVAASYPGRQDVQETLRRYFFGYRSIDVSIKDFTAERGATTAGATFDVEFTGVPKQIGGLDQLLPSAARYRFDVQLVKEGSEWKIESAEYRQVERSGIR
jgi:hypothetical protein